METPTEPPKTPQYNIPSIFGDYEGDNDIPSDNDLEDDIEDDAEDDNDDDIDYDSPDRGVVIEDGGYYPASREQHKAQTKRPQDNRNKGYSWSNAASVSGEDNEYLRLLECFQLPTSLEVFNSAQLFLTNQLIQGCQTVYFLKMCFLKDCKILK